MRISLTTVTRQVADLPPVTADAEARRGLAAATWERHIHSFVRQARLSKPVQHDASQSQYNRLLHETAHHPRFEGMNQEQRKAWLDARVSVVA